MKKFLPELLEKKALELLLKRERMENLRIGSVEMDDVPSTGKTLYKMDAFKAGDPNGPRYSLVLDEDGKEVDLKALSKHEGKPIFARKPVTPRKLPLASPAASITIEPTENILVLNPGDMVEETVTVKVPGDTGVSKVDTPVLASPIVIPRVAEED